MKPVPVSDDPKKIPCGKLNGKIALITGGDSGIGKAVAILFAREGADIAIIYLNEHDDALETKKIIEEYGKNCLLIAGDVGRESFCKQSVSKVAKKYGRIDILVNNAGMHYESDGLGQISSQQLIRTFQVNIFSMFWITKYSLHYMREGSCVINTASVTAYRGSAKLIDYASTKGAIVSFTRSLSANLIDRKIRVNGVAPGPVWTPLIASSFPDSKVSSFGSDVPIGRAGQPVEIAPCYLFLASEDSNYITGQFLHPNGGEIVNG
jgi:NAD(P)-dependent dehydrogenase (short-subunit alcohol dehydrogenase family)